MEPIAERSNASGRADVRLVSVIVPVVERADDLTLLYHAFARELERRGEEHEFLFVFDGGFTAPPELAALSQASTSRCACCPSRGRSARRPRSASGSSAAGAT